MKNTSEIIQLAVSLDVVNAWARADEELENNEKRAASNLEAEQRRENGYLRSKLHLIHRQLKNNK